MLMRQRHFIVIAKFSGSQAVMCNMKKKKQHIAISFPEIGTGTGGQLGECLLSCTCRVDTVYISGHFENPTLSNYG